MTETLEHTPLANMWRAYVYSGRSAPSDPVLSLSWDAEGPEEAKLYRAWLSTVAELEPAMEELSEYTGLPFSAARCTWSSAPGQSGDDLPFLDYAQGQALDIRSTVAEGRVTELTLTTSHLLLDGAALDRFLRRWSANCTAGDDPSESHSLKDVATLSTVDELSAAVFWETELGMASPTYVGERQPRNWLPSELISMPFSSSLLPRRASGVSAAALWSLAAARCVRSFNTSPTLTFGLVSRQAPLGASWLQSSVFPLNIVLTPHGELQQLQRLTAKLRQAKQAAICSNGERLWDKASLPNGAPWFGGPLLNLITWRALPTFGTMAFPTPQILRFSPVERIAFTVERSWTGDGRIYLVYNPASLNEDQAASLLSRWYGEMLALREHVGNS